PRPAYRCGECGWTTPKWVGRCGECQAWGTIEEAASPAGVTQARAVTKAARPIAEVEADAAQAWPTGVDELDRVLGGGIVGGAVEGAAGNVSQVREVAASLIRVAKARGMATVLVGHVTKDGGIAGPRVLEHLVDVVCQFEGDRHNRLRMVRAVKNRYGPTDEVGCFELDESGITGLADPSGLFLSRHTSPVPGTAVTVTLEGRRPLVTEVQALVGPSAGS